MLKKDLGLLLLILVVGTAVALINPRFLSPINLSNTANLIGLFGMFSLAQAFVIITGGIELSVGSIFALARRHLRRSRRQSRRPLEPGAPHRHRPRHRDGRGAWLPGDARWACSPSSSRCAGSHLSRRSRASTRKMRPPASLRPELSDARMADHRTHLRHSAQPRRLHRSSPSSWASSCTARCSAAISSPSARTRRRRAIPASTPSGSSRRRLYHLLRPHSARRRLHRHVYALDLARLARQFLRALRDRRRGARRLLPARRRRLDPRRRAGHHPASGAAEPRQSARHSKLAQFRGDGRRHPVGVLADQQFANYRKRTEAARLAEEQPARPARSVAESGE